MKQVRMFLTLPAVVGLCVLGSAAAAFGHEGDVEVGVDMTGKLTVGFEDPFDLPVLEPALLHGWGIDEPGFASVEEDEPDEGLYVLDPDANVAVEFVSADDAFNMWVPPFFSEILDTPGERWALGGSDFDIHPYWQIDSDDPDFDPLQTAWSITLKLVDTRDGLGVAHADSDPFTLRFVPTPEPATLALLAIGGAGALLRRRRIVG